jgi:hypothetical protein
MESSKAAIEDGWRELINAQHQQLGDCQVTLALLDAMGRFITEIGDQLSALRVEQRPGHVICLIMPDAMEGSSHECTWQTVEMLAKRPQPEQCGARTRC